MLQTHLLHSLIVAALVMTAGCRLGYSSARATDSGSSDADGDTGRPSDSGVPDGPRLDTSTDAPSGLPAPLLRFPWNGKTTGSLHAARNLRPRFIWEPVAGATAYELVIDDTCDRPYASCELPSPERRLVVSATEHTLETSLEVSAAQPVGRRYFWRVRACSDSDTCGAFSPVRYLDVGRERNDYNGDGFGDLVVGAPETDVPGMGSNQGAAFVYYGSADGLGTSAIRLDYPSPQSNAAMGLAAAAIGDVNGDGFGDLMVGAPAANAPEAAEGVVLLYLGARFGLPTRPGQTIDNPDDQPSGIFGSAIAGVGDIDGDGLADVLVAARRQSHPNPDEGSVFLFLGGAAGEGGLRMVARMDNPSEQSNVLFGNWLDGGRDIDGDGFADFVIGSYRENGAETNQGAAYVVAGGPAPHLSRVTRIIDPSPQGNAQFGRTVALADVNGDGFTDVAIGANYRSNPEMREGAFYIFRGGRAGVESTPREMIDCPGDQTTAEFADMLEPAGDLNGDGFEDLVAGSWLYDRGAPAEGNAFVFYGGEEGVASTPGVTFDDPGNQMSAYFGAAGGSPGDIDGDGFSDLVIGAYQQTRPTSSGAAFVYPGRESGPLDAPTTTLLNPLSLLAAGDANYGAVIE